MATLWAFAFNPSNKSHEIRITTSDRHLERLNYPNELASCKAPPSSISQARHSTIIFISRLFDVVHGFQQSPTWKLQVNHNAFCFVTGHRFFLSNSVKDVSLFDCTLHSIIDPTSWAWRAGWPQMRVFNVPGHRCGHKTTLHAHGTLFVGDHSMRCCRMCFQMV
jgi:hypothetical protein